MSKLKQLTINNFYGSQPRFTTNHSFMPPIKKVTKSCCPLCEELQELKYRYDICEPCHQDLVNEKLTESEPDDLSNDDESEDDESHSDKDQDQTNAASIEYDADSDASSVHVERKDVEFTIPMSQEDVTNLNSLLLNRDKQHGPTGNNIPSQTPRLNRSVCIGRQKSMIPRL